MENNNLIVERLKNDNGERFTSQDVITRRRFTPVTEEIISKYTKETFKDKEEELNKILKLDKNIFITGKMGTGKTTLLNFVLLSNDLKYGIKSNFLDEIYKKSNVEIVKDVKDFKGDVFIIEEIKSLEEIKDLIYLLSNNIKVICTAHVLNNVTILEKIEDFINESEDNSINLNIKEIKTLFKGTNYIEIRLSIDENLTRKVSMFNEHKYFL